MARRLTQDEIKYLLEPIYKTTLRYEAIVVSENVRDWGGRDNSITPAGVPHMSRDLLCPDFWKTSVTEAQYVFVHEMMHVWQWGHGIYPVIGSVGTLLEGGGNYAAGYYYDLVAGKALRSYNMEQQAAIVADYWGLVTKKLAFPKHNNNVNAVSGDYDLLIAQLRSAGPSQSKFDQIPPM